MTSIPHQRARCKSESPVRPKTNAILVNTDEDQKRAQGDVDIDVEEESQEKRRKVEKEGDDTLSKEDEFDNNP